MSPTKRRTRRSPAGRAAVAQDISAGKPEYTPPPMPEWKWKAFPVYFAFALGGFIGLYFGVIVQAANNPVLTTAVFIGFALLLGFGLSRISTRFLISRQWVKPRPRKKR